MQLQMKGCSGVARGVAMGVCVFGYACDTVPAPCVSLPYIYNIYIVVVFLIIFSFFIII